MPSFAPFDATSSMSGKALPKHVGFIPDGNRRWAVQRELPKESGYAFGIAPGLALYERCKALGIAYWPDYEDSHFDAALAWFRQQDRTLGG
jgi:undecaprenyl pyrophosphate synthase